MKTYRYWGERDEMELIQLYQHTTKAQIARQLGRSISSIWSKANAMGFTSRRQYREWTEAEIEVLKRSVGKQSIRGLAYHIGRSYSSTRTKLVQLGLQVHSQTGDP